MKNFAIFFVTIFYLSRAFGAESFAFFGHAYTLYKFNNGSRSGKYLEEFSKDLNSIDGLKGIFALGDSISDGSEKEQSYFKKTFLQKLKAPAYLMPGNHEYKDINAYLKNYKKNQSVIIGKTKFIMLSLWKAGIPDPILKVDADDVSFLEQELTDYKKYENVILLTTDAAYVPLKNTAWTTKIEPLLKGKVFYVISGENDIFGHRYTWHKQEGITYLHSGFAHNIMSGGVNSYLVMKILGPNKLDFTLRHLVNNALDKIYEIETLPKVYPF